MFFTWTFVELFVEPVRTWTRGCRRQ